MRVFKKDITSQSLYLEIKDTTGLAGKTGLLYSTTLLVAYYVRNGGSATAITLATLSAANSAYSSGGFKEVDAANMPGVYRLDLPDAALASGADSVLIMLKGAVGMAQSYVDFQLVAVDFQDTTANATALLDLSAGVETGWTLRQALRVMLAALAGKASGLGTATAVYRNVGDTKNRISATVDVDGNRSAVTIDAS